MYNPYDLLPEEYDDKVFPELYIRKDKPLYVQYKDKIIPYKQYLKEKEKKMPKFNEKKIKSYLPTADGKNVKVVLSDGLTLEGSPFNVSQTLSAMGISFTGVFDTDIWYYSDSRGWVTITSMATPHIKNAIVKRYDEWLVNLKSLTPKQMADALINGPDALAGLVAELSKRKE